MTVNCEFRVEPKGARVPPPLQAFRTRGRGRPGPGTRRPGPPGLGGSELQSWMGRSHRESVTVATAGGHGDRAAGMVTMAARASRPSLSGRHRVVTLSRDRGRDDDH